jgi:hypothetical protein
MATLIISTVGTALGGPVGGAIGALIGQSFDEQLLAPASRGPRLGDLSVQTSSYGTQIPRIYGSMRAAGSVVWATDLVEGEQTTGAKGQPDVTYSYTVSLAVAVSSRRGAAIGRIWADGKLLRGVEGDFKVPTTFRFYDGSEGQDIDPLIASVEGIDNVPAYRGLALAVFENLELAAFGNRIPFLTFEVLADPGAPEVSAILADASGGAITAEATATIAGYAAYGRSIAAAVQPLVSCFDVRLFDDGSVLRPPVGGPPVAIGTDELGSSANGENAAKLQREQPPVRAVPSALRLTYYDPARDYQAGEARATAGEQGSNEEQQELPAVLSADDAKSLVQQILSRQWATRDRLTLRLPPTRVELEPGSVVLPGVAPASWIVDKCTIDGFVAVVELRPAWRPAPAMAGDAGRIVQNTDVVEAPTSLALIDAPALIPSQSSQPTLLVAASSASPGWSTRPLTASAPGQHYAITSAARKSLLGRALTVLAPAEPHLIDDANTVDIELVDHQQWLTSCDDAALADGFNLAVLGGELVQFGNVTPLGQGRFRLAHLLRGRGATERAAAGHSTGELFCLLDSGSLRTISLPAWSRGSMVSVTDRSGTAVTIEFRAQSVTPLAPCNFAAAFDGAGRLSLSWTRRSRAGFAWLDEVDAPLGETRERYRIKIAGVAASLELETEQPLLVIAAADMLPLGSGPASIEVRQLGDWSASPPVQTTISLP